MLLTEITRNISRSRRYWEEACKYAPNGAPCGKWWPPHPLYFTKGTGARIYDIDDNEYIDYFSGAGPIILGHNHSEVNQAVIDTIQEIGVQFGVPHVLEIELAKKLREIIPCAEMSSFGNAGTDTISFAVRLARARTGRPKIAKFEGSYQGWADSVVMSSAPDIEKVGPPDRPNTVVESAGVLAEVIANTIVLPYNNLDAVTARVEEEHAQLAAIIVEPMVHSSNLMPRPGFLEGLRQLCDAYGIILIFDEIVTGFRHSLGGAQQVLKVMPDIAVFGKAMANGFIIASISGKQELMDTLVPKGPALVSGTFNGNPASAAASLKTIEVLGRPGFYERLYGLGDRLRSGINEESKRLGVKSRCDGFGSVWCMYFSDNKPENYRDVLEYRESGGREKDRAYQNHMLNEGIFIRPHRLNRAYLNGAHTEEDVQQTIDATVAFLRKHRTTLSE